MARFLLVLTAAASAFSGALATDCSSDTNRCMLLSTTTIFDEDNWGCTVQPAPSLSQCYKHNQKSCCVSSHDSQVAEDYSAILSGSCLREFDRLEHYYCLACNPSQKTYLAVSGTSWTATTENNHLCTSGTCQGKLILCGLLAEDLMYADADSTTRRVGDVYDNCGLSKVNGLPSSEYYSVAKAQLEAGLDYRYRSSSTIPASPFVGDEHYGPGTPGTPNEADILERAEFIFFNGSANSFGETDVWPMRPSYFTNDNWLLEVADATCPDGGTSCAREDKSCPSGSFSGAGRAAVSLLLVAVSAALAVFNQ